MTYEIEHGVLIPEKRGGKKGTSKYGFEKLEIGDNTKVQLTGNRLSSGVDFAYNRVAVAANTFRKAHPGWDYTVRICDDGFVRCWRMA